MSPLRAHFLKSANSQKESAPEEAWQLYYFEGRNTGIAARSEAEARSKKRRGGEALVAVRKPSATEARQMEAGVWVRTRADGLPPGKSEVGGRGMGPPPKNLTKAALEGAADVARELDPAGFAPSYSAELAELKAAVNERRILDIPGKLADAALAGQLSISKATDTNLPLLGAGSAVKQRRKRQDIWRRAFAQRRIPFSEHYLSAGGDFGSPDQVQAAFLAAGKPIDEQQALQLSVRMTAMRDADGPSFIDRDWSKAASAPALSKVCEILTRAQRVRGSLGADAETRPAQGALMPRMGKQASFEEDLNRVLQREGRIGVTTDRAGDSRGGATQAGISQSYFGKNPDGSWKKSKAQIAALTPEEIKGIYADIYKVPNQFQDPGVREVMFDMTTNVGPSANGILQRSVNRMLPADRRIKVDNVVGSGTLAAAQGLDQRELSRHLLDGYSAHHQQLVKSRPDLYATNKNGWANRVGDLRSRVLAPAASPQSAPVFVNNRKPPQESVPRPVPAVKQPAPSAPMMTIQPGGPIPSIPMLSAPSRAVMSKQASHSLTHHFRHAAGTTKSAVLGFRALTGNTAPIKAMLRALRADGVAVSRVRPAASTAQLPHTGGLPVGVSTYSMDKILPAGIRRSSEVPYNSFNLTVGKGRPRHVPEFQQGTNGMEARFAPGAAGGTNPSPIASMMHEGGHHLHMKAMRDAVRNNPSKFGVAADDVNRFSGEHVIPGQSHLGRVLDELGANNAALQVMQGRGATDEAMQFYKHMRRPSFLTHTYNLPQTPLADAVLAQGAKGFTPGYAGLTDFYLPTLKQASLADGLEKEALAKALSYGAVKLGLKPSFRDMLKIRRGLNVTQDVAGGQVKSMNGFKGSVMGQTPDALSAGTLGHYNPANKQVRLALNAGRNTLRHEMMHAYQFQGNGLMRRMADWRTVPGSQNTLKGSLGNAAIEAQAQIVGTRGVRNGLQAWGRVAPGYTKYYGANGVAAMPYQASHALGKGIAAAPAIARGAGYTAAGAAGLTGLAMVGAAGSANASGTQQPSYQPQSAAPSSYQQLDAPSYQQPPEQAQPWPGSLDTTKMASLASRLRQARNKTHTHPTPAQARAGNYAKGSLIMHGMAIKLENPKGTERRGYDKDGNIEWQRTMQADYGYFHGTQAIDGDAVDCFIGPNLDSHFVAAIDQKKSDGSFDETKFVLGCTSQDQAEKLYLAHYPRGWKLGPVATTTVQQLKTWLAEGNTKAPFKGQMVKAADDFRAPLGQTEKAAKDYGKLLRDMRVRKGECPECGTPDQPPYEACGCGQEKEAALSAIARLRSTLLAGKAAANTVGSRRSFLGDTLSQALIHSPVGELHAQSVAPALALGNAAKINPPLSRGQFIAAAVAPAVKLQRQVGAAPQQVGGTAAMLPGAYDRRQFLGRLVASFAADPAARAVGNVTAKSMIAIPKTVGELIA